MLRNIGANWTLTVVQIVVTFVLMPFTIRMLGEAQYGAWLLVTSLTGYLTMLALGIPMATIRYIAGYAAEDDAEALNKTISSSAGLYAVMGMVAMVVGVALFGAFVLIYDIPAEFQRVAYWSFGLVVLNHSARFLVFIPYGVMAAHQNFVLRNSIAVGSEIVRFGLTYVLLIRHASMIYLAVVLLSMFAFEFTVGMILLRRHYPQVRVRLSGFDPVMAKRILSFSFFVLVTQVAGQLAFFTDSLVIGAFLPLAQIPVFTVAGSLALYLMQFVAAVGAVVVPKAASLQASEGSDELRHVYLKWSKIVFSLTLLSAAYLFVLGPRFIGWWISPDFEVPSGQVLRILMVANLLFMPVRGLCLPILLGLGEARRPALWFLTAAILNVALSVVLVTRWGLVGVALGTAVPNFAYSILMLGATARALEIRIGEYLGYVSVKATLGAIPIVAVLWWFKDGLDARGMVPLVGAGLAAVATFALVWWAFVYRNDRYIDPTGWRDLVAALRA